VRGVRSIHRRLAATSAKRETIGVGAPVAAPSRLFADLAAEHASFDQIRDQACRCAVAPADQGSSSALIEHGRRPGRGDA